MSTFTFEEWRSFNAKKFPGIKKCMVLATKAQANANAGENQPLSSGDVGPSLVVTSELAENVISKYIATDDG